MAGWARMRLPSVNSLGTSLSGSQTRTWTSPHSNPRKNPLLKSTRLDEPQHQGLVFVAAVHGLSGNGTTSQKDATASQPRPALLQLGGAAGRVGCGQDRKS